MKGILKLLLIFFVVFYLIRYLSKLISLFKVKKMNAQNQQAPFDGYQQYSNPPKSKNKIEGDYVDFEEVK